MGTLISIDTKFELENIGKKQSIYKECSNRTLSEEFAILIDRGFEPEYEFMNRLSKVLKTDLSIFDKMNYLKLGDLEDYPFLDWELEEHEKFYDPFDSAWKEEKKEIIKKHKGFRKRVSDWQEKAFVDSEILERKLLEICSSINFAQQFWEKLTFNDLFDRYSYEKYFKMSKNELDFFNNSHFMDKVLLNTFLGENDSLYSFGIDILTILDFAICVNKIRKDGICFVIMD